MMALIIFLFSADISSVTYIYQYGIHGGDGLSICLKLILGIYLEDMNYDQMMFF